MRVAVWTPQAKRDLEDILYYIRVTGSRPFTAGRIGEEILEVTNRQAAAASIAASQHPLAPPDWGYIRHKRWLIFYQPHVAGIEVMRVIDGVRDLPRALAD